jgi:hypothetical protein
MLRRDAGIYGKEPGDISPWIDRFNFRARQGICYRSERAALPLRKVTERICENSGRAIHRYPGISPLARPAAKHTHGGGQYGWQKTSHPVAFQL